MASCTLLLALGLSACGGGGGSSAGGAPALVCRYHAYGDSVSVMRHAPQAYPNCKARKGGFACYR